MKIQLGFSEVRAFNGITLILLKMSAPFPQTVRWKSSQCHSFSSRNQPRASRASPGTQNPFLPWCSSLSYSLALQSLSWLEHRRDSYQLVTHHRVLSLPARGNNGLSQQQLGTGGLCSNLLNKKFSRWSGGSMLSTQVWDTETRKHLQAEGINLLPC